MNYRDKNSGPDLTWVKQRLSMNRQALSATSIAIRLFLTCWLVYALYFATNIPREVFPALALGDHLSFRVDEYANMHPDLFEKEGYGWHIGNNPGVSMLAAIPYALARPIIDPVVKRVHAQRNATGAAEPPTYDSPWPKAREFFKESWRRGLDVKLGLGALVMHLLCMAPSSALAAMVMFYLLRQLLQSDKSALWLALLYAFGTPVFFRTGFLNHNLMLGHIAFMGFVAMWNPGHSEKWSSRLRFFLGGLAGGTALLFDYSGIVLLAGLFAYGLAKRISSSAKVDVLRHCGWYVLGSVGPILLLWFYQWKSFGHPLYPGQHWMPPVEWIELGYQGYGPPQLELLLKLAFDYQYGLFASSPLMLLAFAAPFLWSGPHAPNSQPVTEHSNQPVTRQPINSQTGLFPRLELLFILATFVAFWIFFSGSNYTRLQFNTGIRYMAPMLPFLFVPAAMALMRLPQAAIYFISVISVVEAWCLAMHRDVERGLGVLDPILHVFFGGLKLPALVSLSRIGGGGHYQELFANGVSPLPIFALAAAIIYGIWKFPDRFWSSVSSEPANEFQHGIASGGQPCE